jgi:hypothetical protein
MPSKQQPVDIIVRGVRWGLPWMVVLAISSSVAYSMTLALAGGPSAGDSPTITSVVQTPATECESCGCFTRSGFCFGDHRPWADVPANAAVDPSAGTRAISSTATTGLIDGFPSDNACDMSGRNLYVGLNTWIPAGPSVAPCQNDAP